MNDTKEKLILFTRYPVPGTTKTRLVPALGEKGAADLQEIMAGLAVINARCLSAASEVDIEIRYDGANKAKMHRWLGKGLHFKKSGSGDIGRRMHRAFEAAFRSGYNHVVLIGCDCPRIDTQLLKSAFEALNDNDMVIGPATDGGYYLIGLNKPTSEIFDGVQWGTESVYRQTMAIAKDKKLRTVKVDELTDIDTPDDLDVCRDMKLIRTDSKSSISIIIATFNEQDNIRQTIETASGGALEVIVADGGSQDNTVELARKAGASVFAASCPRAGLLNTAALKAKGDILLFLHADTLLPNNYAKAVMNTVQSSAAAAGAFRLGIDSDASGIRFVEKTANLRSRLLMLPYGDQALFMTKDTFLRMGGFADMPIMEDYELVKRLGRRGEIVTLPEKVKTSARRWLQLGVIRTTTINQFVIAGFKIGISPIKLARFYRHQKKKHRQIMTQRKDTKNESALLSARRS